MQAYREERRVDCSGNAEVWLIKLTLRFFSKRTKLLTGPDRGYWRRLHDADSNNAHMKMASKVSTQLHVMSAETIKVGR